MDLETLHDLYMHELNDLYDAENQIIEALPKMIDAASDSKLRDALSSHLEETRQHARRLEQIFQAHNVETEDQTCKGLEGIIDEGDDLLDEEMSPAIGDAAIIAAAQKVEHYEMASYGSARTWANLLGHKKDAELLQQTLNEEGQADKKLTKIAESLNVEAVRRAG